MYVCVGPWGSCASKAKLRACRRHLGPDPHGGRAALLASAGPLATGDGRLRSPGRDERGDGDEEGGGGGRSRRGTHCGCLAPPRGDGSLPLGFSPGPRLGGRLFLAVILGVKGLFSALLVKTSSLTEAGARGRAQEPGCGRWGLRVGFPRG